MISKKNVFLYYQLRNIIISSLNIEEIKVEYTLRTYYQKEDLPPLEEKKFFHYASTFDLYLNISAFEPFMIVAFVNEKPVACMMAVIRRLHGRLRSSLFKQCYISQLPAFLDENYPKDEIFEKLVSWLLKEVKHKVYYIQFRNLCDPIFGYKTFKNFHFYAAKWLNIRNSLQRKRKVWDQLSSTRKNQVNKAKRRGVSMLEATSLSQLPEIYRSIKRDWKIRERIPPLAYFENFFRYYVQNNKGKILLCMYKDKIIGGTILGFEKKIAYCLHYWGHTKRYKHLYPSIFSIWSSLEFAEKEGFEYFDFLDSGFYQERAGKPRFLLQFGGKQKATKRWQRFNWPLINFFAKQIHE